MARSAGKKGGARRLGVLVRTAKGRRASSTRWLQRQLNDPYVERARQEGYRSRAAFKLIEMDDRYRFLKPGARVVDLGAAPGGWSQVAAARVKASADGGQVIAADLSPLEPLAGVTVLQLDFLEPDAEQRICAELDGGQADVVLSDMAAPATGHKRTDHLRIMGLCEAALDFAERVLAPGGTFLAKVLQGGTERELLDRLRKRFASVRHVKPKASRADSAELYVLAQGFRGSTGC
jgi:23S rRNA (uridine2552-2'-O)-methyltransferase